MKNERQILKELGGGMPIDYLLFFQEYFYKKDEDGNYQNLNTWILRKEMHEEYKKKTKNPLFLKDMNHYLKTYCANNGFILREKKMDYTDPISSQTMLMTFFKVIDNAEYILDFLDSKDGKNIGLKLKAFLIQSNLYIYKHKFIGDKNLEDVLENHRKLLKLANVLEKCQ